MRAILLISAFLVLVGCQSTGYAPSTEEAVSQSTDDATSAEEVVSQLTDDTSTAPEGWVRLTFDLDEKGTPKNIEVTDSNPVGIFEKEAIRALSSWKYKPKVVDGKPVVQTGLKVQLDFRLEKEN